MLESCLLEVSFGDHPQAADRLPESVQNALIERMAELDPQADVRFPITCPDCTHHWMVTFDITTFLWQELHTWALRTLDEVNLLARAYAWREAIFWRSAPGAGDTTLTW